MTLAMAASYDPDPDAFCGIRLPVNMHDCSLIEERWEQAGSSGTLSFWPISPR